MRCFFINISFLLLISVFLGGCARKTDVWTWHTPPDRWSEPRIFHTPFEERYESYIHIDHHRVFSSPLGAVFSTNHVYWFFVQALGSDEIEEVQYLNEYGIRYGRFLPETPLYIFTEREMLIRIVPSKRDPDYRLRVVKWINEKLLYLEIWWGCVLGTYYVYDVEKEQIIYCEMVNDGGIPFIQWQGYPEQ